METVSTYGNFSNESIGIYFLYPRNFIIKLLSGGFSQQGLSKQQIEQAGHCASRAFLVYFFNFFIYFSYAYISCITQ